MKVFILGLDFFETSAKDNVNVKQVFDRLVDMICKKMDDTIDRDADKSGKGECHKSQLFNLSQLTWYMDILQVPGCLLMHTLTWKCWELSSHSQVIAGTPWHYIIDGM